MNEINIPKIAVIDTCVLLDALVINYLRITDNKTLKKKWETDIFGNNEKYFKKYLDFLEKINTFVTSSQVIGELQGFANSRLGIRKGLHSSFWKESIIYLKNKKINEQLIDLVTISQIKDYSEFIYEIGYIDTGLIELAKKEKLPIITNDEKTLIARSNQYIDIKIYCPKHLLNN